jgi:hypothetical protein
MRMKYVIISAFLLPFMVSAEVAVGVNLSTQLERASQENTAGNNTNEDRSNEFEFQVTPSVIIAPSSRIEIVPNIGFSLYRWKSEHLVSDSVTGETKNNFIGFGAGCGLFFRLIDKSVFRFSLGPDVQFWYHKPEGDDRYAINPALGLPVNIDLVLSERFFARLSSRLFQAGYTYTKSGKDNHTSRVTFFDINTIFSPSIGFYFSF